VSLYTNELIEFTTSANVVDIPATTPYSRMHQADGTEHATCPVRPTRSA
jgi:hypothetical protein